MTPTYGVGLETTGAGFGTLLEPIMLTAPVPAATFFKE